MAEESKNLGVFSETTSRTSNDFAKLHRPGLFDSEERFQGILKSRGSSLGKNNRV